MLAGFKLLARALQADLAHLRARTVTAAICYGIAALAFVAALALCAAAGVVALVERFGLIEGLAVGGGVLALVGVAALTVNAVMRRRHERRTSRAMAARSALMADTAAAGLRQTRDAMPALLPAAAILSFTLTTMLLKQPRR
jgi:hypothetical protein